MLPFEMSRFWPSRTHSLPSRRAVVWRLPASLPACGSVRAHAPNFVPFATGTSHFFFWSSEPNHRREDSDSDVCTETEVRTDDQPRLNSSTSIMKAKYTLPPPPYFYGTG